MIRVAWKLGDTGYFFERRGDAVDTVRTTYSKVARVVDYDHGDRMGRVIVEFDNGETLAIPLTKIEILERATHL